MKKSIIALFLLTLPLVAQLNISNPFFVAGVLKPAASGCSFPLTETFSSLGNWTEIAPTGVYTAASGEMVVNPTANNQGSGCINNCALPTTEGYMKMQVVTSDGGGTALPGFAFRRTGGAGELFYSVIFQMGSAACYWSYRTDDADYAPEADIEAGTLSAATAVGDWIGVSWTGTGDAVVVTVWNWTSDPGAFASWGTAEDTLTNNPGGNAADTGLTFGAWCYFTDAANTTTLDNFLAGTP